MRDPKKCIIVDDEPAAHYVLANYIKQNPQLELVFQGYNGIEAMDYLREHKVDLMFLDINMPVMDGWALLNLLSAKPDLDVLVIMATSSINERDKRRAFEYPMVKGMLIKPIIPDLLFTVPEGQIIKNFLDK